MYWSKKIKNKNYAIGTATNAVVAIIFGYPDVKSILWLLVVLLGAIINHYSTVYVVSALIESQLSQRGKKISKKKLVFYFVLKVLSLFLAFGLLISFARPMVIHGVVLYIFQLIILGLSIKNTEHFIQKGPLE
ncbi:MAG: hypothetical protein ACJ76H_07540 [Bacteriovoracaceae bacterium]